MTDTINGGRLLFLESGMGTPVTPGETSAVSFTIRNPIIANRDEEGLPYDKDLKLGLVDACLPMTQHSIQAAGTLRVQDGLLVDVTVPFPADTYTAQTLAIELLDVLSNITAELAAVSVDAYTGRLYVTNTTSNPLTLSSTDPSTIALLGLGPTGSVTFTNKDPPVARPFPAPAQVAPTKYYSCNTDVTANNGDAQGSMRGALGIVPYVPTGSDHYWQTGAAVLYTRTAFDQINTMEVRWLDDRNAPAVFGDRAWSATFRFI